MSQFTSILLVSPLSDGKTWVLMRDFGYDVGQEGSGDTISVPAGFCTDFASIPRPFWIFLPKWGTYGNAAVVHDWLYWAQVRTRRASDDILREAMEVLEVSALKKYPIYWAVRVFGWLAWLRNQADRAANFDRVRETLPVKARAESERKGQTAQIVSHVWRGVRKKGR